MKRAGCGPKPSLPQLAETPMNIMDEIKEKTAAYYGIRSSDLISQARPAHIAFPRQVAMYVAREITGHTLQYIGSHFGGRGHDTVHHACALVRRRMQTLPVVRKAVDALKFQCTPTPKYVS